MSLRAVPSTRKRVPQSIPLALSVVLLGVAIAIAGRSVPATFLLSATALVTLVISGSPYRLCLVSFVPVSVTFGAPLPVLGLAVGIVWVLPKIPPAGAGHPLATHLSFRRLRLITRPTRSLIFRSDLLIGIVVGAACALPAWSLAQRRFSLDPWVIQQPRPPWLALVALVMGASVLNSVGEEVLWRGVLVDALSQTHEKTWLVGALTSASFGAAHYGGIPSGPSGVVLAGAFGAVMFVLRNRRGLLAAVIAHAVTDMAIFSAVAANTLFLAR